MKDEDKTKEQIMDELVKVRGELARLKESESERKQLKESQSLKIGEILTEMGYITNQHLQDSLKRQKQASTLRNKHRTLGDIMVESGVITPEQLHAGLSEQLKRLHNLLTVYIDEKLLMDAVNAIHNYGFAAKSSDSEEVRAIFRKWKAAEAGRKRAEDALLDVEEKYRVLMENANEAIMVVQDKTHKFVNPNAVKLTGYSLEELTSGSQTEFVYPDDREMVIEHYERKLKRAEIPSTYSFRIVDKSGNIKWVEINTVLITWAGRPAILNFLSDITDRKQLETELVKVQKLESVGILAGGIAHDFNNILTAILGNISLAKVYSDSEKVIEKLEKAEKASMQAKDLTQELLTFSRGGAPVKKLIYIEEMLRDSAIFALRGSNVRRELSIPNDLWPLEVDPGQISRVINNIVINAVQASSDGGVIKVCAQNKTLGTESGLPLHPGAYIEVSIEDQGIGIPEENLQKIFYPYFTTKREGTGLGLASSYSIIKNHDGYITAESQVNVGTIFHIHLPASPEKALIKAKESRAVLVADERNVMVMDDVEVVRDIIRDMLSNIGYKVTVAVDGTEAIELYRSAKESGRPFDAVIMDLTIRGGMGGKATIKKLIELDPEVKAIVSSGYSNDPIMSGFEKYGFKGVIAKPYMAKELNEVLHRVIEKSALTNNV